MPQAAVEHTAETGSFAFFSPTQPEVLVKVLNGTAINGKFWVYWGSMTDQPYQVCVTDTNTGIVKAWASSQGFCGGSDLSAF